jgi:hypothetical protein
VNERIGRLALSTLVCLGRRQISGLLHAAGDSFQDCSAAYRLFSQGRVEPQRLFAVARREVLAALPAGAPLVVAIDDTLLRKSSAKTPGVAWRRDPLGPKFQVNFIRAQRLLQFSAALPPPEPDQPARLIPIECQQAPTPRRPSKKADQQVWKQYRAEARRNSLTARAAARVQQLRQQLDAEPAGAERPLHLVVDGAYTNRTMLKSLPAGVTLIGRLRSDAKLYHLPDAQASQGRRRCYGERAPTPEQLRQDESVPWQPVSVFAAGQRHSFRVKTLGPLRWRVAGGGRNLRLVVIAPLAYRPRRGSRLLYRQPAYLIVTDPKLELAQILQQYVWRWEIEVNFREQKTLLGVGQAQVRQPESVERVPQFQTAVYALLLLAGARWSRQHGADEALPRPHWQRRCRPQRVTTARLLQHLRADLWAAGVGAQRFSGFAYAPPGDTKPQKLRAGLLSAAIFASG